jgi:hypothetical protein
MRRLTPARTAALLLLGGAFLSRPAAAFDSKGHVVIEALVYRTLIEGHDGQPPRPDVLKDFFNDGDLLPPLCFGWGEKPPAYCTGAATAGRAARRARRGAAPRAVRSLAHLQGEVVRGRLSLRRRGVRREAAGDAMGR